nr:CpsD/CapB family tyrosine-protein kinase [Clostridiales bacterium]
MSELITKYDPKSPISEVFRLLRTNIQYINKDEKSTAIMLTSTTPANGKTFVTANLAITLAQANKRVILVDSDIRKPRLHKVFELENELGLSDYLSNSTDGLYIRKTNVENLSIVTAGTMVNNPSELIGQEKFKKTIEALKEKYDYVIIDSSPILMVTDSILVSRVVDATILIAIYNKTRIDDLKSAIRRINHVGGNVAGVVLNRTKVILNQYNTKYFYGNTIEVNNKLLRMKIKRFFYNRKIKKANKDLEKKQIKEEKTKAIDKNQKMINKINQKNQELEKELLKLKKELENQTKITN